MNKLLLGSITFLLHNPREVLTPTCDVDTLMPTTLHTPYYMKWETLHEQIVTRKCLKAFNAILGMKFEALTPTCHM